MYCHDKYVLLARGSSLFQAPEAQGSWQILQSHYNYYPEGMAKSTGEAVGHPETIWGVQGLDRQK